MTEKAKRQTSVFMLKMFTLNVNTIYMYKINFIYGFELDLGVNAIKCVFISVNKVPVYKIGYFAVLFLISLRKHTFR